MRLIDADAIYPWYVETFKGEIDPGDVRFSMNDIEGNLCHFPTINEWIPVAPDTLPEPVENVLVTVDEGGELFVDTDWGDYYEDGSGWFWCSYCHVIAWMPLPKPYSPQIER